MAENETRLNSNLFKQYQKFGFDIMEYLADFIEIAKLGEINEEAVNSVDGPYQYLTLPNGSTILYTSWYLGQPFYFILYNSRGEYILELDLARLVCIEDRFTWYLAKPRNSESKNILAAQLDLVLTPSDYRAWVNHQKMMLKQGEKINKEGFLLAEDSNWKELVEKLTALILVVLFRVYPKKA
ncbi:hypothetical protein [Snodgrassella alvi]|uniref:hypothetical protein n=1 Tax=Snodgrassella alvi TaxID=1196083 RepID=UPI000995EB23|nr:hypothetical protein [Snodgrassella alvi]OOX78675.1 hypothetical protein BGH94_07425 [Snodgrassella alvi]ORF00500.1 hypothetical protein BGH95_08505 [Snodgrassella alvi]